MSDAPRVAIVEDHALLSAALASALRLHGFPEVGTIDVSGLDDGAVLAAVGDIDPQVVLLDVNLGDDRLSLDLIAPLRAQRRTVLMLTASRDGALLARCLEQGAAGVFDKSQSFDDLVALVRDAAMGLTVMSGTARDALLAELDDERRATRRLEELQAPFRRLTDREAGILRSILDGRPAADIARLEHLSEATVRTHIRSILSKLGVSSQLAAVALAHRAAWPPDR